MERFLLRLYMSKLCKITKGIRIARLSMMWARFRRLNIEALNYFKSTSSSLSVKVTLIWRPRPVPEPMWSAVVKFKKAKLDFTFCAVRFILPELAGFIRPGVKSGNRIRLGYVNYNTEYWRLTKIDHEIIYHRTWPQSPTKSPVYSLIQIDSFRLILQ